MWNDYFFKHEGGTIRKIVTMCMCGCVFLFVTFLYRWIRGVDKQVGKQTMHLALISKGMISLSLDTYLRIGFTSKCKRRIKWSNEQDHVCMWVYVHANALCTRASVVCVEGDRTKTDKNRDSSSFFPPGIYLPFSFFPYFLANYFCSFHWTIMLTNS